MQLAIDNQWESRFCSPATLEFAPEQSLDELAALMSAALNAPLALISVYQERLLLPKGSHGLSAPLHQLIATPSHPVLEYVAAQGQSLAIGDMSRDVGAAQQFFCPGLSLRSVAAAPLCSPPGNVLGALCVGGLTPRSWSPQQIEMLAAFANMAAREIELRMTVKQLKAQKRLLEASFDSLEEATQVADSMGNVLFSNKAMQESCLAGTARDLKRQPLASPPPSRAPERPLQRDVVESVDGKTRWQTVVTTPLTDSGGTPHGSVLVARDVTREKDYELSLRKSNMVHRIIAENLPNGALLLFDHQLRIQVAGGELFRVFGVHAVEGELVQTLTSKANGERLTGLFQSALEGQRTELHFERDGRTVQMVVTPIRDENGTIFAGLALTSDVTELAAQRRALEALALTDELTQLRNRRGFLVLGQHQLQVAARTGSALALFYIDLNGMKHINDSFGHQVGDAALKETAAILQATFREADVVARLGGDEFVVLAVDCSPSAVETLEQRLQTAFHDSNAAQHTVTRPYALQASIGVAAIDAKHPQPLEDWLGESDRRMYQQKRSARQP
jgi:diguanylate cyclase (GGDEF)-like protein